MSAASLTTPYAKTPTGTTELSTPTQGLSISQRKLLQLLDGTSSAEALLASGAFGAGADAARIERDLEKLLSSGLIVAMGGAGAAKPAAGPANFSQKKQPWPLIAGVVLVLGGAGVYFVNQSAPSSVPPVATAAPAAAPAQPAEATAPAENVAPTPDRLGANGQPWAAPVAVVAPQAAAPQELKPEGPIKIDVKRAAPAPQLAKPAAPPAPQVALKPATATPVVAPQVAAPPPVVAPAPVPPKVVEAPKPEVAAPAPAAVPPVAAKAEAPAANRKPLYREQPEFPVEAAREGVTAGSVKARMTVNEAGIVVKVDILDARPRKLFDRAVRSALARWRYPVGTSTFTVDTEINFSN